MSTKSFRTVRVCAGLLLSVGVLCASRCKGGDGDAGAPGAPGAPADPAPTPTNLSKSEDLPGLVLSITSVAGASGADGTFRAGDTLRVTFTVRKKNGASLPLSEVDSTAIWVSGPTFNYQHLIPSGNGFYLTDVKTAAAKNADGSYTYTVPTPIPAAYGPPFYDTAKFSAGELTGQPLLAGTYTVAMRFYKNYSVEGVATRDPGGATKDFLFGGATALEPREVVKTENCNQCHATLQFHGGTYRSVNLCVTCHTSGAEDRYSDTQGPSDTTPVTTDFRVLIHKLHNGRHLPSVLGVATHADGSRNYSAAPVPYTVGGSGYPGTTAMDFSKVGFPVWPNLTVPMPRDQGYSALATTQKGLEDEIRRGVTDCSKCHGDPDGSGPLTAPAQGHLAYAQPSRRACGSCHDDVNWDYPYTANNQTMPSQPNDSACALCHVGTGNNLDSLKAHLHPLKDPALNPGINATLTAALPSSGPTLDPGERLAVTFSVRDDAGTDVQPSGLALNAVVAGPNSNRHLILYSAIPAAALGPVAPSYSLNLPERVALEFIGISTAGPDVFNTARTPHWNVIGDLTSVLEAAPTGTTTTLAAPAAALRNFVDVAGSAGFADGDTLVLDRGLSTEEYLRIRRVDAGRFWFSTRYDGSNAYPPYLRFPHSTGAIVERVTLTPAGSAGYTLNPATGQISEESAGFTPGRAILCSYTTDFVMPSVFPPPLNDSPDLGETWGKWTAKSVTDGTYTVGLWAYYSWSYGLYAETNSYRIASLPATRDFLAGSATTLAPYALISFGQSCNACHNEILFHGGSRRNAETCLLCHATAGSEDWPIYRSPFPADPTPGVTVHFRTMLHKIHMGEYLAQASTYVVNGFNGNPTTFDEIVFPAMPGKAKHCTACHGTSNAWKEPANRDHPTQQGLPVRAWGTVCGSCHDSPPAGAHLNLMTDAGGSESCAVCHGQNKDYRVDLMHKNR